MGRGINSAWVGGNVTSDIEYGNTDKGDEFCTFTIISEKKDRRKRTHIRVNIYQPGLISVCQARLKEGGYVSVVGELMNPERRRGCEVRCQEIVFS